MKLNTFFNHWLAIMLIAFCYAMTSSAQTKTIITSQEKLEELLQDSAEIRVFPNFNYYNHYDSNKDLGTVDPRNIEDKIRTTGTKNVWTLEPAEDGYYYLARPAYSNSSTKFYWGIKKYAKSKDEVDHNIIAVCDDHFDKDINGYIYERLAFKIVWSNSGYRGCMLVNKVVDKDGSSERNASFNEGNNYCSFMPRNYSNYETNFTIVLEKKSPFFTENGFKFYLNSESKQAIIVENYNEGDIIVPEYVTRDNVKYLVTDHVSGIFKNCTSINGGRLQQIYNGEFYNDKTLVSVSFPYIKSIGQEAFRRCEQLKSVDFGYNLANHINYVGSYAFADCSNLETTIFGDIKTGGVKLFEGTEGFEFYFRASTICKKVALGNCRYILDYRYKEAFMYSSDTQEKEAIIPATVAYNADDFDIYFTGKWADGFNNCTSITFQNYAFLGQSSANFANLQTLIFDNSCSIGSKTFLNCKNLKSITFNGQSSYLDEQAFAGCSNLTSVTFTKDKNRVNRNAFYDVPIYQNVTNFDNVAYTIAYGGTDNYLLERNDKVAYIAEHKSGSTAILPEAINYEGNSYQMIGVFPGIFNDCVSIDASKFRGNIPDEAFAESKKLKTIVFGSVLAIGKRAFVNCTNLISAVFGESVASLGDEAFSGCSNLNSISFGSIQVMGKQVFSNVPVFENITEFVNKSYEKLSISPFDYLLEHNSKEATITNENFTGDINIPDVIKYKEQAYTVSNLNIEMFKNCTSIVAKWIKDIPEKMFEGFSKTTSITVGDNIKSIGNKAFNGCSALTSIQFGNVGNIGKNIFSGCSQLKSVSFCDVDSVKGNLGANIDSITFGNIGYIGSDETSDWLFLGINGPVVVINDPASITFGDIREGALIIRDSDYDSNKLTSVTFGNTEGATVKLIHSYSWPIENFADIEKFSNVSLEVLPAPTGALKYRLNRLTKRATVLPNDYTGDIVIPAFVYAGKYGYFVTSVQGPSCDNHDRSALFKNCVSVDASHLSDGKIYRDDFSENTNLKSIIWGNLESTEIPSFAFYGCTNLSSVSFGNIKSIGGNAFYGCTNLSSASFRNVETIGDAFSGCTNLSSLSFEDVGNISNGALRNLNNLVSVTFGNIESESTGGAIFWEGSPFSLITDYSNNTAFLKYSTFNNYNIKSILSKKDSKAIIVANDYSGDFILPMYINDKERSYSITDWEPGCLNNCTSIKAPDFYRDIKTDAFNGASRPNFTTVDFEKVKNIERGAFAGCQKLTSVKFDNVENIGDGAFNNCPNLTTVNLPKVKCIGYQAFRECSNLTTVNFNTAESIGDQAFSECSNLTTVNCNNVESIGVRAFEMCSSLTSINFEKVKSIGHYAFSCCQELSSVKFDNVENIGAGAFDNCPNLSFVVFPKTLKELADIPFRLEPFRNDKIILKCYVEDPEAIINVSSDEAKRRLYSNIEKMYVKRESLEDYKNTLPWSYIAYRIFPMDDILVESIEIPESMILYKDKTEQLTAKVYPSNADIQDLRWTSDNPQVASVDKEGLVTALDFGEATITAMSRDGSDVYATCKVTVKNIGIQGVTFKDMPSELTVGDYITNVKQKVVTDPQDADCSEISIESSNPNVLRYYKDTDKLYAKTAGNATVTVRVTDTDGNEVSATQEIIVTPATGIGKISLGDVKLIVNKRHLKVEGLNDHDILKVVNAIGFTVYEGTEHEIDLHAAGIYIVKVKGKTLKINVK